MSIKPCWQCPLYFRSIATLRKAVGLSVVFFSLGSTLMVLSIGACCPYPPNFLDESLKQQHRLLKRQCQHSQGRRILWHRYGRHRILLRSFRITHPQWHHHSPDGQPRRLMISTLILIITSLPFFFSVLKYRIHVCSSYVLLYCITLCECRIHVCMFTSSSI